MGQGGSLLGSDEPTTPPTDLVKANDSLYELHTPFKGEPNVEIIFFHGLQRTGDPDAYWSTWTSSTSNGDVLWPKEWLPQKFPLSRIYAVSYDSFPFSTATTGRRDLFTIGESLVADIIERGDHLHTKPIVLVGHGVGGLVIKQFLLEAHIHVNTKAETDRSSVIGSFLENVKGIFFLSTSHFAVQFAAANAGSLNLSPLMNQITTVETDRLTETFRIWRKNRKEELKTFTVRETFETQIQPPGLFKRQQSFGVSEASARYDTDGYFSVASDHFQVSRPASPSTSCFQVLVQFISAVTGVAVNTFEVDSHNIADGVPVGNPETLVNGNGSSRPPVPVLEADGQAVTTAGNSSPTPAPVVNSEDSSARRYSSQMPAANARSAETYSRSPAPREPVESPSTVRPSYRPTSSRDYDEDNYAHQYSRRAAARSSDCARDDMRRYKSRMHLEDYEEFHYGRRLNGMMMDSYDEYKNYDLYSDRWRDEESRSGRSSRISGRMPEDNYEDLIRRRYLSSSRRTSEEDLKEYSFRRSYSGSSSRDETNSSRPTPLVTSRRASPVTPPVTDQPAPVTGTIVVSPSVLAPVTGTSVASPSVPAPVIGTSVASPSLSVPVNGTSVASPSHPAPASGLPMTNPSRPDSASERPPRNPSGPAPANGTPVTVHPASRSEGIGIPVRIHPDIYQASGGGEFYVRIDVPEDLAAFTGRYEAWQNDLVNNYGQRRSNPREVEARTRREEV